MNGTRRILVRDLTLKGNNKLLGVNPSNQATKFTQVLFHKTKMLALLTFCGYRRSARRVPYPTVLALNEHLEIPAF